MTLNYLEYKQLQEDASVGADYEPAIVMGYYTAQRRKIPTPEKMEIRPIDFKKISKSAVLSKAGVQIAKKLIKSKVPKGEGRQLGSASLPITAFWKKYGGSNTTPKTDLILGNHRISLKIGPAQLMSGSQGEARATFYAALQDPATKNITRTKEGRAVIQNLENFVLAGFTPTGTVEDVLKGRAKKGGKIVKDRILSKGDKNHKAMIKNLSALFERSEEFKLAFIREAMTGEYKFGKRSDAMAQWFLVGNKTGSAVSYHTANDKRYIKKVADQVKVDIRFKSNSQKIKGEKTGSYRYYSVLGLAVNKLIDVKEEVMIENGILFEEDLTEGLLTNILNRFKNWISGFWKKVKAWIEESAHNLIEFFQVDPIVKVPETIVFPS